MWENDEYKPAYTGIVKHDSLIDGVAVPGLQCAISGFLFGLTGAVLAGIFNSPHWWKIGAGLFVVATLITWLTYRAGWQDRLEKMLGLDLNLDGRIGAVRTPAPPQLPAPTIRVELQHQNGQDWLDLPFPDKLPQFAASVIEGRTYSQTAIVGSGKLFSRGEYDILVSALISAGLAYWKNPEHHNQGWNLSSAGRAVFKRIASPTLPAEVDRK